MDAAHVHHQTEMDVPFPEQFKHCLSPLQQHQLPHQEKEQGNNVPLAHPPGPGQVKWAEEKSQKRGMDPHYLRQQFQVGDLA